MASNPQHALDTLQARLRALGHPHLDRQDTLEGLREGMTQAQDELTHLAQRRAGDPAARFLEKQLAGYLELARQTLSKMGG